MNKQIEEMALVLSEGSCGNECDCIQGDKFNCHLLHSASILYNAGYRKQSEADLREEVTTDDFYDLEFAKERGWHRKKFYCPNCDLLIKTETWDSKRMFGNSTVLKTDEMPNFCPNCGAKMKGE